MKHEENKLQAQVCRYLKLQYPSVLFISDLSGQNMHKGARGRHYANSKQGFSCPDLIIFKTKKRVEYDAEIIKAGLFLELKVKTVYKKNGELLKNEHLEKQQLSMWALGLEGYDCYFAIGFDHAKQIIDNYLK